MSEPTWKRVMVVVDVDVQESDPIVSAKPGMASDTDIALTAVCDLLRRSGARMQSDGQGPYRTPSNFDGYAKVRLPRVEKEPAKTFAVTLYIDADDLDDETVDRIYEAGFDDATLARSGGKTKVMLDRDGESWLNVAIKATKQIQDAGFVVTGMEWDKEME